MLDRLYTDSVAEALDIADAQHWTRPPPRSDQARLRFLTVRHTDLRDLALRLHTTPTALHRLLKSREPAPEPLQQAIAREVIRLWQPRVRRRAHSKILTGQHGLWVHFRGWFGFAGAAGASDDGRIRNISEPMHAPYVAQLFDARYRSADEVELRCIVADALGASYFNVSPTGNLRMVQLTDLDYIEFSY